jgi:hypothetical protein
LKGNTIDSVATVERAERRGEALRGGAGRNTSVVVSIVFYSIALVAPPSAAVPNCTYANFSDSVVVNNSAAGDVAKIERSGDDITMNGNTCSDGTTTGTVQNTAQVVATDASDGGSTVIISLLGGPFEPGSFDEPGTSDEIEFNINFDFGGPAGSDRLRVAGAAGGDRLRYGIDGGFRIINLNADESSGIDGDAFDNDNGVNVFDASGGQGPDRISGAGGAGTGTAFDRPLQFVGGDGADRLTGGSRGDNLRGGAGGDTLVGGEGRDLLVGGPGIDTCQGGPGRDTPKSCET